LQDGEANLLAPEFSLLSTLHQLAWRDDLQRRPLPARGEALPEMTTAPVDTRQAAPVAPPELVPARVSVSAYASLVACPYRFFARHVLRLGEMDEVSEEMEKSDYGELVHRVLERFHSQCQVVSACSGDEALEGLQRCVEEVFGPAIESGFLATGWRLRWEKHLAAYLDWQREREAQGWRWWAAETRVSRELPLENGKTVELYGRIDRIDYAARNEDGTAGVALYDYKTQSVKAIKDRLKDDVQLPSYALMHGNAAMAAYVALDDENVAALACGDEAQTLMREAENQGQRLIRAFNALHAGTPLSAHGVDSVCRWCEVSGLCRKEYV
jgi:ATP-dependent helicase/nuclease subunit B